MIGLGTAPQSYPSASGGDSVSGGGKGKQGQTTKSSAMSRLFQSWNGHTSDEGEEGRAKSKLKGEDGTKTGAGS